MKSLAILIGLTDYQQMNTFLPCNRNVDLISKILEISGKYQDILLLNQGLISSVAKYKLAEFIRIYQDAEIDEIFIYYIGYGARAKGDFLYLFADFNEQRLEQTSLRNSEFDTMLGFLNPKCIVKVIDVCQMDAADMNSNQDLKSIFDKSLQASFHKAYFLFLSSSIGNSITLQNLSVFTKSFVKSLLNFGGQNIHYSDVMAFILDDPDVIEHQTPLLIQHADNAEIFINVSEAITEVVKTRLSKNEDLKDKNRHWVTSYGNENNLFSSSLLVQKIKDKSELFCSEAEASNSIDQLKIFLSNFKWTKDISEHLFDIELDFSFDVPLLASKKEIAQWLSNTTEDYFTLLEYETESYEVDVPTTNIYRIGEYRKVTKYRSVLKSFRLTAPAPFKTLIIQLAPKEQILSWYKIFITIIFSKSKLIVFYKFEREKERNWGERFIEERNKWKTMHCYLKKIDEIQTLALQLMKDIENQIILDIQSLIDLRHNRGYSEGGETSCFSRYAEADRLSSI